MAVQVSFDPSGTPLLPHLILATKSGRLIREIPINDVQFTESLVSGSEFSFTVYKNACLDQNGEIDKAFWKKITDFKLAYCRDFDRWYELKVDMTESSDVSKSVSARSLGEAELSQIDVYGIEINTETDIEREDYEPTVLYDASHPKKSLIDRLLYKAPHYRVEHVDDSIKNVQRTFAFDGMTVYDCFSNVSQEIGCLFLYDCREKDGGGIDRTISVYDLEYHCPVCGLRGEYMPICENCGNETLPGYGTDTSVFVARDNLAHEVIYTTNTDAVKNCFRLEAGDDLMTASVVACNPNGSQYIWYITDEMKADMTQALQDKLNDYDDLYEYYLTEHTFTPPSDIRSAYNTIISKYQYYREDLEPMPAVITGYPALMNEYFNTIDLQMYLESELMPSRQTSTTDAEAEAAKLTNMSLSPVAVANLSACTADVAASAVIGMAKCIVRGNYQVKATESSISTAAPFKQWNGKLQVTNYGDEEDTASTASLSILISDDLERYIQQKIDRMINQTAEDPSDISELFELPLASFTNELKKYCKKRLLAFRGACQAALDILIQQGVADAPSWVSAENNLYQNMYLPYKAKMAAIEAELAVRESEIRSVAGTFDQKGGLLIDGAQTVLAREINTIRAALNFEAYVGDTLWKEFAGYRRDGVYKNDNYISDGLSNYELMVKGEQFMNAARQEIFKSATMQHSIQATMSNLLAMEEFQPLKSKFRIGNWIRILADGDVYRLRLSEYTINYTTWNIDVSFTDLKKGHSAASDVQNLLMAVKSMQTTYGAVARQASEGEEGKGLLDTWVNDGLALTTNIVGGAENQEFTMDESGFTGRELIPETGEYSPEQVKIISHGLYMTDDGWVTAKAAIGRFRLVNPQNGYQEEDAFGVIADKLVGNLILGQEVGIYNRDGSMTMDENGFTLITEHTGNQKVFNIKRHNQDDSYSDIVSLDASGNLVLQAYSTTGEMNTAIETSAEGVKTYVGNNYSTKANTVKTVTVEYIVWDYGDDEHAPPNDDSHWSTDTPVWEVGKFIWQHTKTSNGNDAISYSNPVCIQGAAATVYSMDLSNVIIVEDEEGIYTPASITVSGKQQTGASAQSNYAARFVIETTADNNTWTIQYTSSVDENSKTYTIPSGIVAVRFSMYRSGGTSILLDRQIVPVVSDGETGAPGKDAYTVILTNENHTFAGGTSAAIASSVDCGVIAYKGVTQVATTIGSITGAPTGMSTSITGNGTTSAKFTVSVTTSMTTRNGTLTVPVTVDGKTFNMVFTYSLALKGESGTSPTAYSLLVSHAAVGKAEDGTYNPTSITMGGYSQTGSGNFGGYSGRFKIETTADNSTWTTQYTSSANENTKTYTIPADIIAIRCSLYMAGGTTTLLDQQTIPIVSDGADGQPGQAGKDAYTVILTNENHTFAGGTSAAIASSVDCGVIAYKGATQVATTIGSITGAPTGMSTSITGNGTTSAKFTVSVTTSMTTRNGTLTVPVTVDGKTFNMVFTYSLALIGERGEDGIGIASIEPEYYLSTSDQEPTGGSWNTDQPEWEDGKYIWTRSKITWDDSTQADPHIGYTDPVLASAINGANEQAHETNQTLVTYYSTTEQTNQMISSKVSKTQAELVTGKNQNSSNLCPYPLTKYESNAGDYEMTDNGDGTYSFKKVTASTSAHGVQNWGGSNVLFQPGTYTVQLFADEKATTVHNAYFYYYDGITHSVKLTRSQPVGLRNTYTETITFSSQVTGIRFQINTSSSSGYEVLWWPKINAGSTALPWETPNGSNKRYSTNNLCPCPMVASYSNGTAAPIYCGADGVYSGTLEYTSTRYGLNLRGPNPGFTTGTYSITIIEEASTHLPGVVRFYNGSSYTNMTATTDGDIKTYKCQVTINSSASYILFQNNAASTNVGTFPIKWSIMINAGTEYLDWETPSVIGDQYSLTESYSMIEQTAESINLKVSVGDVAAQLTVECGQDGTGMVNLGANRVTINSDHFKLAQNGSVTSDGQFKTNGVITTHQAPVTADMPYASLLDAGGLDLYCGAAGSTTADTLLGRYGPAFKTDEMTSSPTKIGFGMKLENARFMNFITSRGGIVLSNVANEGYPVNLYGTVSFEQSTSGNGPGIQFPQNTSYIRPKYNDSSQSYSWQWMSMTNIDVLGLTVNGNSYKNKIIESEHYGPLAMNAMESTYCVFSDLGSGIIGEDGLCYVMIDPDFSETVDLRHDYQIFTTQTSEGGIAWVEKHTGHFIVHGTALTTFDWILYARQTGFTEDRMCNTQYEHLSAQDRVLADEQSDASDDPYAEDETMRYMEYLDTDYDMLAEQYMEEYEREIEL